MKMWRLLAVGLAVAAAIAAAVLVNLTVLGAASSENGPLGTLSPRATLPPAPAWTVRPRTGDGERSHSRDD